MRLTLCAALGVVFALACSSPEPASRTAPGSVPNAVSGSSGTLAVPPSPPGAGLPAAAGAGAGTEAAPAGALSSPEQGATAGRPAIAAGVGSSAPQRSTDYWIERFGGYMSPEFLARYLATPEAERFRRFEGDFLEFERREALLAPHRNALRPEDLTRYRALPDFEACRRFVEDRFPR